MLVIVVQSLKPMGPQASMVPTPSCEGMLASDAPPLAAKFTGMPSCAASCSISAINACPDRFSTMG